MLVLPHNIEQELEAKRKELRDLERQQGELLFSPMREAWIEFVNSTNVIILATLCERMKSGNLVAFKRLPDMDDENWETFRTSMENASKLYSVFANILEPAEKKEEETLSKDSKTIGETIV